jgi:hypothetical protein
MSLTAQGSNVYAAVWGYGIYVTTNNGTSWSPRAGADSYSRCISSNGGNLYAGGLYGLYVSSNGGTNWISGMGGISPASLPITSFAFSGSNIFASGYSTTGGVYLSTNGGLNWTAKNNGMFQLSVYSLYYSGSYLFAGVAANPSVFKSVDMAENWDASGVGLSGYSVNTFLPVGINILCGTAAGVFYTTNNGDNWLNMSSGLPPNQNVASLVNTGGSIFAAVGTVGVWKRGINEVGINQISPEVPGGFSLSQNYPNPFNPVTNIKFSIPKAGNIKLVVYDAMGREAVTLVNSHYSAGTFNVDLDASMLASGVYFYKLELRPGGSVVAEFTDTKKMMIIK